MGVLSKASLSLKSIKSTLSSSNHSPVINRKPCPFTPDSSNVVELVDQNDESLNRWKASLGISSSPPIPVDPKDQRRCVIKSLALEVEGRPDITIDLTGPGAVESLKSKPFTIKEGAKFRMKANFVVQHDVLSGLKYLQVTKRKGIRVAKSEEMIVILYKLLKTQLVANDIGFKGSFAPNTQEKPIYEKKCKCIMQTLFPRSDRIAAVDPDEAPAGMMARGHYDAVSKFQDDDKHDYLKFEWSFDIAKDWK